MTDSLAGKLLLATPKLDQPETFRRTVILICSHDENAALGLVLNRPLHSESVQEHMPALGSLAVAPEVLFQGGPVEPTTALSLGQAKSPEPGFAVVGQTGLMQMASETVSFQYQRVRVFAGYAGWAERQLDGEIAEDSWFVVDALEEDVFSAEPETLWRRVLQRQSSSLAMFAHAPLDAHSN